ncbi:endothelial differentiation-related factor 1-like isoform X2 [Montipora capricornis]|uniref:endothelial differentiation-related factor 1-like isoform X2 n=1 Tax=Montipora foliosa TaxID=591990 RepID=UPI0035F11A3C
MAESDWDTVTYLRKKAPRAAEMRSKQAVASAQRHGVAVETTQKYGAGGNKQHSAHKDSAKLDRETEELHHDKVSLDVGKLIQQGRVEKKLTQKDLSAVSSYVGKIKASRFFLVARGRSDMQEKY